MPENPLQDLLNLVAPNLGFTAKCLERFIAWAHYLHWADLNKQRFLAWEKADDMQAHWQLSALMSAWFASLWVVVEGWRGVPLSDPSVDELLASNRRYLDVLRDYRNCVFHYQPTFTDRRAMNLLREDESLVHWMFFLHDEFCRFYWELVQCPQLSPALASEICQSMLDLVGWIPSNIVAARARALREKSEDAIALLRDNRDFESEAALRLLEAARGAADGAAEAERDYRAQRAGVIEKAKSRSGPI